MGVLIGVWLVGLGVCLFFPVTISLVVVYFVNS